MLRDPILDVVMEFGRKSERTLKLLATGSADEKSAEGQGQSGDEGATGSRGFGLPLRLWPP
jgi:hypothetical protein